MSHDFYKGNSMENDIQKMSHARNICAYGSNWETNGDRRGILSNISAPPRSTMFPRDDNLPCHPVKNVIFIYWPRSMSQGIKVLTSTVYTRVCSKFNIASRFWFLSCIGIIPLKHFPIASRSMTLRPWHLQWNSFVASRASAHQCSKTCKEIIFHI